jgi:hypothetical protein
VVEQYSPEQLLGDEEWEERCEAEAAWQYTLLHKELTPEEWAQYLEVLE